MAEPKTKKQKTEAAVPCNILYFTVMNPVYDVTVDVIHAVTSPYGKVLRIVIFRKNGVQTMVEFDSLDTAKQAKTALEGADIYAGCCTLRIGYAKTDRLNVFKNDENTWDYENPNLGSGRKSDKPALLGQAPAGKKGGNYGNGNRGGGDGRQPMPPGQWSGGNGGGWGGGNGQWGNQGGGWNKHGDYDEEEEEDGGHKEGQNWNKGGQQGWNQGGQQGWGQGGYNQGQQGWGQGQGQWGQGQWQGQQAQNWQQGQWPQGQQGQQNWQQGQQGQTWNQQGQNWQQGQGQWNQAQGQWNQGATGAGNQWGTTAEGTAQAAIGFGTEEEEEANAMSNIPMGYSPLVQYKTPIQYNLYAATTGGILAPPTQSQNTGCVVMIHDMVPDKMNCVRLFNLLCLYGNVCKIKFLRTKEGSAMVQMGDGMAVERVMTNLKNCTVFGNPLHLQPSKQVFLSEVQQPFDLPDSTASFMDFTGNKNNRYLTSEQAQKNRVQPPSKVLHFFNTPPGITEDDFKDYFFTAGVSPPVKITMFPHKLKGPERSSSGLMEFETVSDAVDALVVINHTPISAPISKFPYVMKLCFSSSRNDESK